MTMSELKRPTAPTEGNPPAKRHAGDAASGVVEAAKAASSLAEGNQSVKMHTGDAGATTDGSTSSIDVARAVGLKPGDRIQVLWDLHIPEKEEEGEEDASSAAVDSTRALTQAQAKTNTSTIWWGATLLQADGRTHALLDDGGDSADPVPAPLKAADSVVVPIRVLNYDPQCQFGFHDRSLEDVVFLSDQSLLNLGSDARAQYRRELSVTERSGEDRASPVSAAAATAARSCGEDVPFAAVVSGEEGIRNVLDSVLVKALSGVTDKLDKLDAAQQRFVAGKIADAKEKLVAKMVEARDNSSSRVCDVTPDFVKKCMEEIGPEL